MPQCQKCKEIKPGEAFNKDRANKSGYSDYCKECRAEYRQLIKERYGEKERQRNKHASWLNTYGITPETYYQLHREQDGLCAICRKPQYLETKRGTRRWLYVDHDHTTGAIRGLLCHNCNSIQGYVNDDTEILERMIQYINDHKQEEPRYFVPERTRLRSLRNNKQQHIQHDEPEQGDDPQLTMNLDDVG